MKSSANPRPNEKRPAFWKRNTGGFKDCTAMSNGCKRFESTSHPILFCW